MDACGRCTWKGEVTCPRRTRLSLLLGGLKPPGFCWRCGRLPRTLLSRRPHRYLTVAHLDNEEIVRQLSLAWDSRRHRYGRRLQPSRHQQASHQLLNIVFWLDAISISDPSHGSGSLSLLYLLLRFSGTYRWLSRGLAPRTGPKSKGEIRRHLRNMKVRDASPTRIVSMLKNLWKDGERGTLTRSSGRFLLRYHAEQAPNPASRVQLQEGSGGATTLEVDYRIEDRDMASVLQAHHLLDQWLRSKGYGRLEYLQPEEDRSRSVLCPGFRRISPDWAGSHVRRSGSRRR